MPLSYPPTFKFEVAFATDPLAASPTWTDITTSVRGVETKRGRSHEIERMDAGTATAVLTDQARRFDPLNTASPFYPNVLPMRKVRMSLNDGVTTYQVFTGYVERWPPHYLASGLATEVPITIVDGFDFLGDLDLQTSHATLTTAFGGNADVTFTARGAGIDGNAISVMYYQRPLGPSPAPASAWFGSPTDGIHFIVTLGPSGPGTIVTPVNPLTLAIILQKDSATGAIVTTAAEICDVTNSHPTASQFLKASIPAGQDGTGVVPTAYPPQSYLSGATVFLSGGTYARELSGTRMGHLLDDVSWPAAERNLDAGQSIVTAAGFDLSDEVAALTHAQDTSDSEGGYFFMAGDGRATFHDRDHRPKNVPPSATFGDLLFVEDAYIDLVPSYDRDGIANSIRVELADGTVASSTDATSQTRYGKRTIRQTPNLTSPNEAQGRSDYLLYRYKDPHLRFERLIARPGPTDTSGWAALLPRELGDRILIKRRPVGGGPAISQESFIEQISLKIRPTIGGSGNRALVDFDFQLSPADLDTFLLFDDATYGLFDTGKFGAY